jgi:hypothetical protein
MYLYRLLPKLCPRLSDFPQMDGMEARLLDAKSGSVCEKMKGKAPGKRGIGDTLLAVFLELETLIL